MLAPNPATETVRIAFSEKDRSGIGTFTPSDPKSQDISELVGGIVVKLGSQQIDASIRTKLNRLAQAMKG